MKKILLALGLLAGVSSLAGCGYVGSTHHVVVHHTYHTPVHVYHSPVIVHHAPTIVHQHTTIVHHSTTVVPRSTSTVRQTTTTRPTVSLVKK